jgi:hypothetical protein
VAAFWNEGLWFDPRNPGRREMGTLDARRAATSIHGGRTEIERGPSCIGREVVAEATALAQEECGARALQK